MDATRRVWRGRGVLAGALAAVVGLVAACDDGGTGPNGDTAATVVASVTLDGSPEPGVSVALYAEAGSTALETATTDAEGEARFPNETAGTYDVEVTPPSGAMVADDGPTRKTTTVAEGGEATVSFALVTDTTGGSNVEEVHLTSGFEFTPSDLTIEPGTTVRWVNDADIFHTITPDGHSEWSEGSVSSTGDTFEHTFDTEGTFPYYCSPHLSQGMTGSITVQAQ